MALTSFSVAAKMPWIFVVTSARLASSLVLVFPFAATSAASAAPLLDCMPATPVAACADASVLCWATTCCSCSPELRGRGLRVCRGGLLVVQRLLELRLVGLRELLLGDLALRHLLVGLVRSGGEVELLGRGRLGCRARCAIAGGWPGCSGARGVTGLATAFDWSGGASVAVSMSLA